MQNPSLLAVSLENNVKRVEQCILFTANTDTIVVKFYINNFLFRIWLSHDRNNLYINTSYDSEY